MDRKSTLNTETILPAVLLGGVLRIGCSKYDGPRVIIEEQPLSDTFVSIPVRDRLLALDPSDKQYAATLVDMLLDAAIDSGTSDVHLQPSDDGLFIRWRIDGVLQQLGEFPRGESADVVARLKVLAGLLTYRSEVPQEGRLRAAKGNVEMRVSTFPTIQGERAVIRLFAKTDELSQLHQLGFPEQLRSQLVESLHESTGAILITGPAGSGKTTTVYACLRYLVESTNGGRSLVSLEDPVEVAIKGVAQSQANPVAEFDLNTGLKSLLRQDPEVILIGEIRDRDTAHVAFQAALTGQLMLTTFHAGSAAEAVSRLVDMDIEPYLLRSGILCIVSQRLVRQLCECAEWSSEESDLLGLPINKVRVPQGCDRCSHTGYHGRMLIAEILRPRDSKIGRAILDRNDAESIEKLAIESGMQTQWENGLQHVVSGATSAAEFRRVMGYGEPRVAGRD